MTDYPHHPPIIRYPVRPLPGTDRIVVTLEGTDHVMAWDDAYTLAQCLTVALDMTRQRGD